MRLHFFVAFLLCVTFAAAELEITVVRHDSDVQTTYSELKACSCGFAVDEFRVKNIGQLEASYSFSIDADQPWFTLEKNFVYLNPGQTTDIVVFTHAPCGAVGTGTYKIYVTSEYGRYRAMEKTIETGVCQNIVASISPQEVTVQPCSSQEFLLNLTNPATFREHYTVEGLGFSSVTLDPDQNTSLSGWYNAACDEWGTKDIPVTVRSTHNKLAQEFWVHATVPRAYDYTLSALDVQRPVCAGVPTNVQYTIQNTEARANTFSVRGEPWSNSSNVYAAANRTTTGSLSFTPVRAGEREFTIDAISLNGTIEKQVRTTIPVEACYGFTLGAAASVNSCPGAVYIPFAITNQGTQQQNLTLDVQSNTTTAIDSLDVTLNPSQVVTKTIEVQVPDVDRQYYVTLNATSPYSHETATTMVRGYSTESCYMVGPTNTHLKVWTDQTVQPIIIEHTGIQPATYTVSYNGTLGTLLEKNISLSPQGQTVVHLLLNSTGHTPGRYVGRLTLSTAGVDYVSDIELQLREKGFWQQFLDACRWNSGFAVCSVASTLSFLVMLFVLLAVVGIMIGLVHYENPVTLSKQTAGLIGSALLILLLVAMIVTAPTIPRTYERDIGSGNASALYYEMGAGEVIQINATDFFSDPDNDLLSISASQSSNLDVRVQNGVAQIHADEDFRGQETIVFSANDRRGGVTDSELVTINVVPFKPVTFLQFWQYACWFLTFLFLFIAIALALLTSLFIKDVKADHEAKSALVLYRKPRTTVVRRSAAHDLVEQADTNIRHITPGTTIGQVVGTQIITPKGEQVYVASQEGTKFHRITCPVVKGMPKDNRLTFSTKEEAIRAGYTPCKTCSSSEN